MIQEITHLGIDIGGAHIKIIGINIEKEVVYVNYSSCQIWKGIENLKREFQKINSTITDKSIKCGITMSAELCDNFKNRKHGVAEVLKECKNLNFDNYFYVNSSEVFSKNPEYKNLISMNWHSIGRFLEKKINNTILIDFGSTTTDFICIKNKKIINKHTNDFSRLNNLELLYSGLTRTPIFGLTHYINFNKKKLHIIPEFFSDTSDIYRILKKLNKKVDLDETADNGKKQIKDSLKRISRSFGFDYERKYFTKLQTISKKLSIIQLDQIFNIILKLQKKYVLKNEPVIVSGIGQDLMYDYLKKKKIKTIYFKTFLRNSTYNKEASYHAPALSIALLLQRLK